MQRTSLDWGHRYLMCPPDYFTVEYAINPWMDQEAAVDRTSAQRQWHGLVTAIEQASGRVETVAPDPSLPDMVFSANAGVVTGGMFLPARMRFPERDGEPELYAEWAAANGFIVQSISGGAFEGMGDALPFADQLIAGHGQRSSRAAWRNISQVLAIPVLPLALPDPRLYHIDLVFAPLDSHSALIAPAGLTDRGLETLQALVPDPVLLTDEEALKFAANSIVIDRTVISPYLSTRLCDELRSRGFHPVVTPVGEFLKAGGAVRCLTLPLDIGTGAQAAKTA